MTNIDEATLAVLSKLNKTTAEKFIVASESENRLLETPSFKLTKTIGGYGYGRINFIWGNRSSGKTVHVIQAVANAQRDRGEVTGWIDAERNFDKAWAKRLGANPDGILLSPITSVAEASDAGVDLIRAGANIIVLDSISTLLPTSYLEDGELKEFTKTGQIGTFSKDVGKMLNTWNSINQDVCVLVISQVRTAISNAGGIPTYMGGKAVDHITSAIIKLWSNPNPKESKMVEMLDSNGVLVKKPGMRAVTWTVDKNRGPGMHESDDYDLYFKGDFVGIDIVGEIVDVSAEYGFVKKGGAWYTYAEDTDNEIKIQGRDNFIKAIRDDADSYKDLYEKVMNLV